MAAERPHRLELNTPGLLEQRLYSKNRYPPRFEKMDMVPAGRCRGYAVEKFSIAEREVALSNLRAIRDGQDFAVCPPGNYTRLVHGNLLLMSDTPMEAWTNKKIVDIAAVKNPESILIAGLGLGMVARALLKTTSIRRMTIVESSPQVMKLVGSSWCAGLNLDRDVEFHHGSIWDFKPAKGQKWDLAYYDIWPEAGDDYIVEGRQLARQFGKAASQHVSWPENYAELMWD